MNIRDPRDFYKVKRRRQRKRSLGRIMRLTACLTVFVVVIVSLVTLRYFQSLPTIKAQTVKPHQEAGIVNVMWPKQGSTAIGVVGRGVLATNTSGQTPKPMASMASVMTALAVLKKRPLKVDEQGPLIPITPKDIAIYDYYVSNSASALPVFAEQQLSQYQALQAILLPSANNVADTLATWAYGSLQDYHKAANQMAKELGMSQTTFAVDAGGLAPNSVSTPHDMVLLGQAALQNPVIKEIVAQPNAEITDIGTVYNVNTLLGQQGIRGLKTGISDQAGGCFLFAADHRLPNGKDVTIVGAIMGAPDRQVAMQSALPLLTSLNQGFGPVAAVAKGQVLARYNVPWDGVVEAVAAEDVIIVDWKATKPVVEVDVKPLRAPQAAGAVVGTATVRAAVGSVSVPLVLKTAAVRPTTAWRFLHH